MTKPIHVGSICSGIEAASVAWEKPNFKFDWFSEISAFPSKLLKEKYPEVPNLGDMCNLPNKIATGEINAPDLICGGTPCQAFSLAGWKKGLEDTRGNLTLRFVDIINANDDVRLKLNKSRTIVFWENVEGVLRDKTNAFGCLLASLAGYDTEIKLSTKWPQSGFIKGPLRNIAWRVLDAKYFGLPQQRRRLYLIAGGKEFNPEEALFEIGQVNLEPEHETSPLTFEKDGHSIEVFRSYTDCLYSAYGTKWNGNAAAYNGSLFVAQNKRLRRLTPLECERLMGFPDRYTNLKDAKFTSRYQATGNSWAVPVVKWLGQQIIAAKYKKSNFISKNIPDHTKIEFSKDLEIWVLGKEQIYLKNKKILNATISPCNPVYGDIRSIIDVNADEKIYITPVGCKGILRRTEERKLSINSRLKFILEEISSTWTDEKIETISRRQSRGRFSKKTTTDLLNAKTSSNLPLFIEDN